MKITKFVGENFKRISAVEISPTDPHTVVIAGRNAQGKSSVLDGIMAALAGKKGAKELTRPIRDGEARASVLVELGDLLIERKWTPSGSTLTVGPKDGSAKFNSPQKMLDGLIGDLSFDPLAFAQADSKKQVETLIDIIGREAFDALASERQAAYSARTDANRDVKSYRAAVDQRADVTEATEVDVEDLVRELDTATTVARLREEWGQLETRINEMRARQADLATNAQQIIADRAPREAEAIRAELSNAAEINRQAQAWVDKQAAEQYLAQATSRAAALNDQIDELDKKKAELIRSAPLPVDGLSFDEDGVLYNGVPFGQSSAAERLRVSVAMAMAMNPDVRVICVRDASLLDDESFAMLVKMAEEKDYQVWYEQVGNDGGPMGVVIEDGMVKA